MSQRHKASLLSDKHEIAVICVSVSSVTLYFFHCFRSGACARTCPSVMSLRALTPPQCSGCSCSQALLLLGFCLCFLYLLLRLFPLPGLSYFLFPECTFIILDKQQWAAGIVEEEQCMLGDVNIFLTDPTDQTLAELEIMIAGDALQLSAEHFLKCLVLKPCFFFLFRSWWFQSRAAEEKAWGKRWRAWWCALVSSSRCRVHGDSSLLLFYLFDNKYLK